MFSLKGLYEWKLIDIKTGKVDSEGSQWNVVSDRFLDFLCLRLSGTYDYSAYENGMAILLSDSTTTPGVDYRVAGTSNNFNILATGSIKTGNVDFSVRSKYTDNNFSPGASLRTIRIIGIKIYYGTNDSYPTPNFVSFVELSTPITQNTDQYLYVKYTIYVSFIPGVGYNTPNNRFLEFSINNNMFGIQLLKFGSTIGTYYTRYFLSYFLETNEKDKVARLVTSFYESASGEYQTKMGSTFANWFQKTFAVTDIVGPIGSLLFQITGTSTEGSLTHYFNTCYGYSPIRGNGPSISRIYVHPSGREDQIFSDPSYPASSQGTITITGTPTNKFPLVAKIRITKTGDASDLVDETVSYTSVDPVNDTITVTQDYTTGDIYKLTSTGALPSPLVSGTNYYIIRVDATTIKLATTYDNALAGIAIDITSQGSGDHTLFRQNTGRYRLELRPFIYSNLYRIRHLSMAIDYDGYVMPLDLDSTTNTPNNYAEGDYIASTSAGDFYTGFNSSMLRGALRYGDYIYSVQQSRKGLINDICRWKFNTIETSEAICKFGTSNTKVSSVFANQDGTIMYITTNEGIYEYSFLTPTTPPVLRTISGMIDNDIKDACLDPVTGYIWTGHTTGLCKIDPSTWAATAYTNTGLLAGLSSSEINVGPGQLDVYNGRVLKGGHPNISGPANNAWVFDDGVGYYRVNGTTACLTCCLRKGTTHVIWKGELSGDVRTYNVTVTGPNSGSSTQIDSQTGSYIYRILSHMCQITDNTFLCFGSSTYARIYKYTIGSPMVDNGANLFYAAGNLESNISTTAYGWVLGALRRCEIDLDLPNRVMGAIWYDQLLFLGFNSDVVNYQYGWDGSKWVKELSTDRPIPKTNTHTLVDGLSISFNNATGVPWDQQFIAGEFFSFLFAPCMIKDNLQQLLLKARNYYCNAQVRENLSYNIPSSGDFTYVIPEKSDPNFRDMDTLDFVTEVREGSTYYTKWTLTGGLTFTVSTSTDILTVSADIPTGTPIVVTSSGTLPSPLATETTYYAINVSSTQIRLATSYNNAISNVYIDITSTGSGTHTLYRIQPSTGQYYSTKDGIFTFSSSDASKTVYLTYTYTKFTT